MANASMGTGLQLRSTVKKDGILELSLVSVATPEPKPEEVIVRIDASPINPSDQGLLFAGADMSTAQLNRTFGMAWGIGGWLLTAFLQKIGFEAAQKLRERVAAEIKTTFASTYTKAVSLAGALQLEEIAVYGKQATGEKYLINPNKELNRRPAARATGT